MKKRFVTRFTAWTTILAIVVMMVLPAGFAAAFTETSRTSYIEPIAEGVTVETVKIKTAEGSLNVYVMKVDLTNPYVKIDTLVGTNGVITSAQSVSKMAKEAGAVAAINGDFFQMDQKAPIGLTYQNGQLVTSPAQRKDMYGFGLTHDSNPVFEIFSFQGTVTAPGGQQYQLYGINKPSYLVAEGVTSDANRLNMYTPRWGAKSRGKIKGLTGVVEMIVINDQVAEIRIDKESTSIPPNGYVLTGHGPAGEFLKTNFKVGDPVQVSYKVTPETDNLYTAVGGQALLVKEGKQHWFTQNIKGKKARTAIGASKDGKTLYFVVVEAGKNSRGMTQEELADFMVSIGAWTAMNLDGGGSSTMVARHLGDTEVSLLNTPVYTAERAVPTGIGIFSTAPSGNLAGLRISGSQVLLVGSKRLFTAKGYDVHYNPYIIQQEDVEWEITPGLGEFQGNQFIPTKSGAGRITATVAGVSQEYPVTVLGSSDITKIEVTPSIINLNPGGKVNIGVRVTTKQGYVFTLQPDEYIAKVTGEVGSLVGGVFTAGEKPGSGELEIKVDATAVKVRVVIGEVEEPFYNFDTDKTIVYGEYPAGEVPGSFRYTKQGEPVFRGLKAARLQYDFTVSSKTRAAYGKFKNGLELPGRPVGIGLWVLGAEGNGHWLRARVVDSKGKEKLLDLAQKVDWQGWKHLKAYIPQDMSFPVKLTDIYLVELENGPKDKGVVYFDELSIIRAPKQDEIGKEQDEPSNATSSIPAGKTNSIKLDHTNFTFENKSSKQYSVSITQLPECNIPTPGYNAALPFYEVLVKENNTSIAKIDGTIKGEIPVTGLKEPQKAEIMVWDESRNVWEKVLSTVEQGKITFKTDLTGVFALVEDAHPAPVFSDLESHWAREQIYQMSARKMVKGYPDGTFKPDKGITRAEFVTLLVNTLGWEKDASATEFKDEVPSWAEASVNTAVKRGVVKGYSDGTFKPNKVITRAEMAVMIDNALNLADSSIPSNYKDAREIPSWAVQAIRDTKVAGIMRGSNNLFRPQDTANRSEAAAVMANSLKYYINMP